MTFVSIYFWYLNFSTRNTFSVTNIYPDYIQWTQKISESISTFMIIAPLALFFKCLKLLHIFEFYSPSFGLLLDTFLLGSRKATTFLFYIALAGVPFIFMSHFLLGSYDPTYTTMASCISKLSFLFFDRSHSPSNKNWSIPLAFYYYPCILIFQTILMRIFLSMLISNVNEQSIKGKALLSEAYGRLLYQRQKWRCHLWANLVCCRSDRRSREQYRDQVTMESEVSERGEVVFNGKRVMTNTIWERVKFKIKYNINKVRIRS